MALPSRPITVLLLQEGEAWNAFAERIAQCDTECLVVPGTRESELIHDPKRRETFFTGLSKRTKARAHLALKRTLLITQARRMNISVVNQTDEVTALLGQEHVKLQEVLKVFSPHVWRRQVVSKMQRLGLLSMPRMRIFSLVLLSAFLFFFVILRLLPSAEIRIRPRSDTIMETANVLLAQSGATYDGSARIRSQELVPVVINLTHSLTLYELTKEFIGQNARVMLTVRNDAGEQYSLRPGTRFVTQTGGIVARSLSTVFVDPGSVSTVDAEVDPVDMTGQIAGDRGNVPAGSRWSLPGLTPEERALVYAVNEQPGKGGVTAYHSVLKQDNLDLLQQRLQEDLVALAHERAKDYVRQRNDKDAKSSWVLLSYDELTRVAFSGVTLPLHLLDQPANTATATGSITYTIFMYDATKVVDSLKGELVDHVQEGKKLVSEEIDDSSLIPHVIAYDDNLSWVKLTADLTALEQYVLDPLTPAGAIFAKTVRDKVAGLTLDEARRILHNLPEVDAVSISVWPPWSDELPSIPSHISVVPAL